MGPASIAAVAPNDPDERPDAEHDHADHHADDGQEHPHKPRKRSVHRAIVARHPRMHQESGG